MTSEDLTGMGSLKVAAVQANIVRGAFLNDGVDCDTILDARGANADWDNKRVVLTLHYANGGNSTLKITEVNNTTGARDHQVQNLSITGIADPVANQDAANKNYVDNELHGIINIHAPVIQRCNVQITGGGGISGYAYASDGSTLTFEANAGGFSNNGSTTVTFGGVTARVSQNGDRVLFSNVNGAGASGAKQNGVYTLTSIGSNVALWTRATDMNHPDKLMKGEMVLVIAGGQGTSVDEGIGYILDNNVTSIADSGGTEQKWLEHHGQNVQEFEPVLVDVSTVVKCKGADGGGDEGKALIGIVAGNGKGVWGTALGKAGQQFVINATIFTLDASGTIAVNATTKGIFNAAAGAALITSTTSTTINCTGAGSKFESSANKHIFSKVAAGTTPVTQASTNVKIGQVETAGHITCLSSAVAATADNTGAGILFDSVNASFTANRNTFLMCPHSTGTANVCELAIIGFPSTDNDTIGTVMASWALP